MRRRGHARGAEWDARARTSGQITFVARNIARAMPYERLTEYSLRELDVDANAVDGPFLMRDGSFGLMVSLRGKNGGSMPSHAEVHWSRDVPARVRNEPVALFLLRGGSALHLGMATVARRGKPARDGFMFAFGLTEPIDPSLWREIVNEQNAPPAPPPEEAIAKLTTLSTTSDRMAAMDLFAERWFGRPTETAPFHLPLVVPLPLARFYALVGDRPVCTQNSLVAPANLVEEDGKLTFYIENQGVCVWAVEIEGDDPPVRVREEKGFTPESPTLSEFLIGLLLFEAVLGAPFSAHTDALDGRSFMKLKKRLKPFSIARWSTSKTQFFGGDGVSGFAMPNGEDFDVWIGARDRVRLEPFEELVSEWSSVGF